MRADRLLSLLMLLQTRGRVTARELAERLEVSERTIYRDLEALSAAGIPVYAERGPGGGCALLEGYRTQPPGLTEEEVRALFVAAAPATLTDLGLKAALEKALLKLLAALPASARQAAERARQRFHLDPAAWHPPDGTSPHMGALQRAIWNDRRLRITWDTASAAPGEERVDPYGLVAKAGAWYLVGATAGATRAWPVAWIQAATVIDEPCQRPARFALAACWAEWCAQFSPDGRRAPGPAPTSLLALLPPSMHAWMHSLVARGTRQANSSHGTEPIQKKRIIMPLALTAGQR
jgi:predicted DNA-binding transcriptional regulator YafY